MRGLGIGIAVTAVIMGISANGKTGAMTDAQIVARAKELGMVDGVLTELTDGEDALPKEDDGAETKAKTGDTETAAAEAEEAAEEPQEAAEGPEEKEAAVEAEETDTKESDAEEAAGPQEEAGLTEEETQKPQVETVSTVTVAVYPGEGSYTVSRKLAALGLVESADLYDNFLCQNGYDKKLCTGNYEIAEGATAEEIAKILTKSR